MHSVHLTYLYAKCIRDHANAMLIHPLCSYLRCNYDNAYANTATQHDNHTFTKCGRTNLIRRVRSIKFSDVVTGTSFRRLSSKAFLHCRFSRIIICVPIVCRISNHIRPCLCKARGIERSPENVKWRQCAHFAAPLFRTDSQIKCSEFGIGNYRLTCKSYCLSFIKEFHYLFVAIRILPVTHKTMT